jgi:hypothetical protein
MSNPCKIRRILIIVHGKKVTTSTTPKNKNLNGQHRFLPFKVANIITQSMNNGSNQLKTKVNISKQAK